MNTTTRHQLPELSEARITHMEDQIFARIATERVQHRRTRRRVWSVAGVAAAVAVVAIAITPMVNGIVDPTSSGGYTEGAYSQPQTGGGIRDTNTEADGLGAGGAEPEPAVGAPADPAANNGRTATTDGTTDRQVIRNASASMKSDDARKTITAIANDAKARQGYVESMQIGTDPATLSSQVADYYTPYDATSWITVRIPADQLQDAIDSLSLWGTVGSVDLTEQDVTQESIDLDARITATQTAVDRLQELVAKATSVSDLIAAEAALSQRQADLQSYEQQKKWLDDQVGMASLSVSVSDDSVTVDAKAEPKGFWDGVISGWNGVIVSFNAVLVALGFMLPWIAFLGIIALIVWGIIALVRSRRRSQRTKILAEAKADAKVDADAEPQTTE